MKFGLMFFASSEDALAGQPYRLVSESARFGDRHQFSSIWVPERHFTRFGGLYPNPSLLQAHLAGITQHIQLRAGSVVLPLHHPLRIAEEWAMVDQLSGGRAGISVASGWNPGDFAFFPERYETRREAMAGGIETLRKLWRGEPYAATSGTGEAIEVEVFPKPLSGEIPIWMTAAGHPQTYINAGTSGANLLTHLLDQGVETLAERIQSYRQARAEAGFDPATGQVSLMLHTLVGEDAETTRELAREPYCDYLKNNIGLLKGLAKSRGSDVDVTKLPEADLKAFLNYIYDRFAAERGLIGSPQSCLDLVRSLDEAGVDEIACLLDFGPTDDQVLQHLPSLNQLRELAQAQTPAARKQVAQPTVQAAPEHAVARIKGQGTALAAFSGAFQVWQHNDQFLAEVTPIANHAALFQLVLRLIAKGRADSAALEMAKIDQLALPAHLHSVRWLQLSEPQKGSYAITLFDAAQQQVGHLTGLKVRQVKASVPLADHLYSTAWHAIEVPEASAPSGLWLILGGTPQLQKEMQLSLRARGATPALVVLSEADQRDDTYWVVPQQADAMAQLLQQVQADHPQTPLRGVMNLAAWSCLTADSMSLEMLQAQQQTTVATTLHVVQQIAKLARENKLAHTVDLITLTRGAYAVMAQDRAQVSVAPLAGLMRGIPMELDQPRAKHVDVAPQMDSQDVVSCLLASLGCADSQIAVRDQQWFAPQLQQFTLDAAARQPAAIRHDASYVITGGLGGLGLALAQHLATRGARSLVLMGRRAPSAAAQDTIASLQASGVRVQVTTVDVADGAALQAAWQRLQASLPPIRGVFHLAGLPDSGMLDQQDWPRFQKVRAAKVDGTWNLHRLTQAMDLDIFAMFSSVASVITLSSQSNYGSASAFMDAMAHYRRSLGLPAHAINWGPWAEVGHATWDSLAKAYERFSFIGLESFSPAQGFKVMDHLLNSEAAQVAVVQVNWQRLVEAEPTAGRSSLLRPFVAQTESPQQHSAIVAELSQTPAADREALLIRFLCEEVTSVLKLDVPPDPRHGFFDIGMDSLMALELRTQLQDRLARPLPATLVFDHASVAALATWLLQTLDMAAATASEESQFSNVTEADMMLKTDDELAAMIDAQLGALDD